MNTFVQIALVCLAVGMFIHGFWKGRVKNSGHRHGGIGHKHGGSILSVDYFAYASGLRQWNVSFKVIFAVLCLLLCIILDNIYVSVMVILMMGYLTVVVGGLPFHHYISMMLIPIVFLLFGSAAIAIGFSLEPAGQYHVGIFHLFYIYCSNASLLRAAGLILKALGAVSALYMMTLTTPLGELISVLRKAHIPPVCMRDAKGYSSGVSSLGMRMLRRNTTRKETTSELPKRLRNSCGTNCRISGAASMPRPSASAMPTIMRLR